MPSDFLKHEVSKTLTFYLILPSSYHVFLYTSAAILKRISHFMLCTWGLEILFWGLEGLVQIFGDAHCVVWKKYADLFVILINLIVTPIRTYRWADINKLVKKCCLLAKTIRSAWMHEKAENRNELFQTCKMSRVGKHFYVDSTRALRDDISAPRSMIRQVNRRFV